MIGNDLVDLTLRAAHGKAHDERFVQRVFTAREAAGIQSAASPDRMLWMLWAAKEAAFKVDRKFDPGAVFSHRSYEVFLEECQDVAGSPLRDGSASKGAVRGRVLIPDRNRGRQSSVRVEWETAEDWVHCVALGAMVARESARIAVAEVDLDAASIDEDVWSTRERTSIHSTESKQVRRLAKELARQTGLGAVEVVRSSSSGSGRRGPPRLFAAGSRRPLVGWDVSLSHDGAFVAAVLAPIPARSPVQGSVDERSRADR